MTRRTSQYNLIRFHHLGHEHPYMIKKKDSSNNVQLTVHSDDGPLSNSAMSNLHHSSASLNQIPISSHDFELRKRDFSSNEHLSKRLRFFHRRRPKDVLLKSPLQPASYNDETQSSKSHRQFFGETLDDLIKRYDQQLPPVIQVDRGENSSAANAQLFLPSF